ncbi:MAG: ATP-binding protein, partial [Alphaproteobacteria bacterium]|nr:ATP-binding protein [Alphaproteobacteria bacterium]
YESVRLRERLLQEQMNDYTQLFFENEASTNLDRYISDKKLNDFKENAGLGFGDFGVAFLDQQDQIIFSRGVVNSLEAEGKVQQTDFDMKIWSPDIGGASMRIWAQSEYFLKTTVILDDQISQLVITHSATPIVNYVEQRSNRTMVALLILLLCSLAISRLITSVLISPISRLEKASQSFRERLNNTTYFMFPDTGIQEYDNLSKSLQKMSQAIYASFKNEEKLRNSLEDRVRHRTKELERLSIVASQTTNSVVITDANGSIEWVNNGFTRLTGYTRDEVLGKKPGKLLQGPETDQTTIARIRDAIDAKLPFHEEIVNYSKKGRLYWTEIICTPIKDQKGNVSGFVAIQNDVTERKQDLQNLIEARQKAEAANSAKTNFLATMSHEIRTPLNGILGMTEIIANSDLNDDQREKLRTVQHSGKILLAIINDVLDMSKIEAGAIELEHTAFNLKDLLSGSVSAVNSLAMEKGLKFIVRESGKCPEMLLGDPVRIRQVIWNLLSNAIKFTESGSVTMDISCSYNNFRSKVNKNSDIVFKITVADTGKGIEDSRQDLIFKPFTQEDNTITRSFGGTGLGLSITKNIIELMQGSISLTSKVNKGTTFEVYLPLDIAKTAALAEHLMISSVSSDIKLKEHDILIAEDNETNALIARAFIDKLGQKTRVAENGRIAVDEVQKRKPDLIFMDIHMPEMNGLEATEKIRAQYAKSELPIIGLTAEAFKDRHEEFLATGMDAVITKPFTENEIKNILIKYLTRRFEKATKSGKSKMGKEISPVESGVNSNQEKAEQVAEDNNHIAIGDITSLRIMTDSIGVDTFMTIAATAPDNIDLRFNEIVAAKQENDLEKLRSASHALKGVAASLHLTELQQEAARIEAAAKQDDVDSFVPQDLQNMITRNLEWLNKSLEQIKSEAG